MISYLLNYSLNLRSLKTFDPSTTDVHFYILVAFCLGSVGTGTDWTTRVRFPSGERNISSPYSAQTGSGAQRSTYQIGTGGSFAGGNTAVV
jgi:hypothetical protein